MIGRATTSEQQHQHPLKNPGNAMAWISQVAILIAPAMLAAGTTTSFGVVIAP